VRFTAFMDCLLHFMSVSYNFLHTCVKQRIITGPPTQCRWARLVTVAGVSHCLSSVMLQAGGRADRPRGRPTLHGGPVWLRLSGRHLV